MGQGNNSVFNLGSPWDNLSNTIWLGSSIHLYRNIEKFHFPGKLPDERKKQMISHIGREVLALSEMKKGHLLQAEQMSACEKEFLSEHFLSLEDFQQAAGGEGFIFDNEGHFLLTLNRRDHLHFHMLDTQGNLETSWNRLLKIETAVGNSFHYSYSPKFGFLTADPAESGTAMRTLAYIQPTALVHLEKIDEVLDKITDESILITGIQGSPNEIIGDLLVCQNAIMLGIAEESIIGQIRNVVTKIEMEETAARHKLKTKENPEIKDRVSRAFGILSHSYQIEAIEALNALSLLKLGLDMGWCEGVGQQELNHLFFLSRRAHLMHCFGEKLSPEEVLHKRAEFIHQRLKSMKLNI